MYNVLITSVAKNTFSNKVTVGINVAIPSFDKEGSENEVKYFNEIRDINTIKAPVFIKLPDDCEANVQCIAERVMLMKRQIYVV